MSNLNAPQIRKLTWLAGFSWGSREADKADAYVMELLSEMVGRPHLPWRA